jgi:hypothetical protein
VRFAKKRDANELQIVAALEAAGWRVYRELPVDLLCHKAGVWKLLEVKEPANKRNEPRLDKRQTEQAAFIALTNTPYVVTPEQALEALEGQSLRDRRAAINNDQWLHAGAEE